MSEPEEENDDCEPSPDYGACRECQEEADLVDGVCEVCSREECPTCEGSGYDPEGGDEDADGEFDDTCPDCGGDGAI